MLTHKFGAESVHLVKNFNYIQTAQFYIVKYLTQFSQFDNDNHYHLRQKFVKNFTTQMIIVIIITYEIENNYQFQFENGSQFHK